MAEMTLLHHCINAQKFTPRKKKVYKITILLKNYRQYHNHGEASIESAWAHSGTGLSTTSPPTSCPGWSGRAVIPVIHPSASLAWELQMRLCDSLSHKTSTGLKACITCWGVGVGGVAFFLCPGLDANLWEWEGHSFFPLLQTLGIVCYCYGTNCSPELEHKLVMQTTSGSTPCIFG